MGVEEKLNVRPDVLNRIKAVLNDSAYRDAIESSSSYNNGIITERKLRLPYLDSQTGVAQSDCSLWMQRRDRMPGHHHGQLYTYPAKRWKKKRRQYLMNDNYLHKALKQRELDGLNDSDSNASASLTIPGSGGGAGNNADNNGQPGKSETNNDSIDKFSYENSKEAWYQDFDDGPDLPDAGELDDPESDFDDYEEYGSRKKKKKKTDSKKKTRSDYSDAEKPFSCDICGARYKTRPGLSYHYSHSHQGEPGAVPPLAGTPGRPEEDDMPYMNRTGGPPVHSNGQSSAPGGQPPLGPHLGLPPLQPGQHHRNSPIPPHMTSSATGGVPPPPGSGNSNDSHSTSGGDLSSFERFEGNRPNSEKPLASPQSYCDFCLGDSIENKKTKSAEIMVSCSDCGRSAHPTCLQFTPNMIASVKKYRWQCIECKSCGLCGTSDNDDQLLFCDDCDRGYHMYCLKPPLSEPPEGSWSCHLCIVEYHNGENPLSNPNNTTSNNSTTNDNNSTPINNSTSTPAPPAPAVAADK